MHHIFKFIDDCPLILSFLKLVKHRGVHIIRLLDGLLNVSGKAVACHLQGVELTAVSGIFYQVFRERCL